jgi:hypothetical protein
MNPMKPSSFLKILYGILILVIVFVLSGFILPKEKTDDTTPTTTPESAATPEPTNEVVHKDIPGSPVGKMFQTVHDQVDEKTASQNQAFGGDDFNNGKYERPFDQSMTYLPLVDLVSVQLNREDPLWVYVLLQVDKPFSTSPEENPHFLVEIDTNLDNHGDVLIVTGKPVSEDWSTETVLVLSNPDLNVGGVKPVKPDTKLSEGQGYYEEIFNNGQGEDADLAWSRLSKTDPAIVEIAFKNTITGGEKGKFIWLPWTDIGMLDWSMFEFNDHFTFEQAGYPLKEDAKNYPVKAVWGVDNTCRVPSGFTPTGYMPGLCPNYDPTVSRESKLEKNCPVCPPIAACPPC